MMDFVLTGPRWSHWIYFGSSGNDAFHIYLYEKGYLDEPPDGIVDFMDELEPEFIETLKKRFSKIG